MKLNSARLFLSLAAVLAAGPALAKVPYFSAKCPTDVLVETDRSGRAYVGGQKATARAKNANYSEIKGGGIVVSVAREASGLTVTYTGKGGANGVCQVLEQETADSAAASSEKPAASVANGVPKRDKQACLRAVKKQTHNPKVVVMGGETSEANNSVTLGVGAQRAPWRCLVKDGKVAEVMSQADEGAL